MSNNSNNSGGGIGILGALFVLFVGLKLTGVINWSWWYVSAPLWGPLAIAIVTLVVYLILRTVTRRW